MTFPVRAVNVSYLVAASPDEVFQFVADTRNDPVWCPNISNVVQVRGDGVELGGRFRCRQAVSTGSRTLESDVDIEIVGLADRAIEWRVEDRFQIRDVSLLVEPRVDGSKVRQRTLAAFKRDPGVARFVYPFLARRTFRDQFSRLAEHLSSSD